ncbi:MAG TPA: flagellar protein FlaG [Conexibacter sp.]|nr:flagellar protein FlaG [Conexibacter sp.]
MGIDLTPIGSTSLTPPRDAVPPRARAAMDAATISPGEVPAYPPPEVLEAATAAQDAYEQLHAQGRELRFDVDEDTGRVTVAVQDLDGNVLRTIPGSKLLDVATGAPLD